LQEMTDPEQKIPQEDLLKGLQALMLLRVLFISLLMAALIFIQARASHSYLGHIHTAHYLLLSGVYLLSIVYVILFRRLENLRLQAYVQLLTDTVIITVLIYTTGGIESIFSFLYILCIFCGSILLYRRGGMIMASSSSILYGALLDLHYYGVIHPLSSRLSYPEQYPSAYLFFTVVANMAAFYLVAYLSSFLSEQARKSRTALQVKESDLTRLEVLHQSIIGSLTSGLIVLDDEKRIILFNPAAEKMFGVGSHQVLGSRLRDHLPQVAAQLDHPSVVSSTSRDIKPQFVDTTCRGADGNEMHLQISMSPLEFSPGERKGLVLILQDVTQMKQIQKEMKEVEGLALIGELAAGMAHEIRNPMASISGSIEMMKEELGRNDVNRRLMDIILRETDRLNDLVADFLLFARNQRPKLTQFDLNQLILESVELFRNSHKCHPRTRIVTNLGNPVVIESDAAQLKQVVWNVLLNASEAMGEGGTLHIATSVAHGPDRSGPERATVVFRDTGKGFDEKALSRVFLPFFTTKERGSGLGLAIVKRIVDRLGGKTWARNHDQGGAEITILLPVRPMPAPM
jgi:two-component system, NtrC family, sensor histidine kinase PilS